MEREAFTNPNGMFAENENGIHNITLKHKFVLLSVILTIFIAGCVQPNTYLSTIPQGGTQGSTSSPTSSPTPIISSLEYNISKEIAKLPFIDDNSIGTFEKYKNLADSINNVGDILNEKTDINFHIPKLDATSAGYEKISKVVKEYAPLVKNYNKLVNASKVVKQNDLNSVKDFHTSAAIFGAEASIIYVAAFALPVYKGVGVVYRASGMQTLAFKCSTCVSVVLEESHRFARTALVDGSSQAMEAIAAVNGTQILNENNITIDEFENKFGNFKDWFLEKLRKVNIDISKIKIE